MALMSTLAQLEEVQAAISAIMTTGQSYTIDNQTFTRASLDKLCNYEARLQAKYSAEVRANRPRVSQPSFRGV